MIKTHALALLLGTTLALTGCTEENPVIQFGVTYSLEVTGQSTVASVTYTASSGPITVANPPANWSVVLQMSSGEQVAITATGTVQTGLIRALMSAETVGRSPFTLRDECVENSGFPTACTVTVPPQALP